MTGPGAAGRQGAPGVALEPLCEIRNVPTLPHPTARVQPQGSRAVLLSVLFRGAPAGALGASQKGCPEGGSDCIKGHMSDDRRGSRIGATQPLFDLFSTV